MTASFYSADGVTKIIAGSGVSISPDEGLGEVTISVSAELVAGVAAFNNRTGVVSLTSSDVTTALGYTPLRTSDLSTYATLASPSFSGVPTAPTAANGTANTQVATTAFVAAAMSLAGAGTVTSASVVSANGFSGTVATASTTPAITISTSATGVLKGASGALTAAVAGTDYLSPSGSETIANKTYNGYTENVISASSGTAYTFNLATSSMFAIDLTHNCTFTMPTPVAGKSFRVLTKQHGGSGRVPSFTGVVWAGGTMPSPTSTTNKYDKYVFECYDGVTWIGADGGRNF